jgi:hypothetical protein
VQITLQDVDIKDHIIKRLPMVFRACPAKREKFFSLFAGQKEKFFSGEKNYLSGRGK